VIARDSALIATLGCTGLRAMELRAVTVQDLLHETYGDLPAVRVRDGKGAKQRMVVYGDLSWWRDGVNHWLALSGITEGIVFRGMKSKKYASLRGSGLTVTSIERTIARYSVDGLSLKPHDLRRTFARICRVEYDQSIDAIRQNLGHSRLATTENYIGNLSSDIRAPRKRGG